MHLIFTIRLIVLGGVLQQKLLSHVFHESVMHSMHPSDR